MWNHTVFLSTAVSSLPLKNFVNSACFPPVCPSYPQLCALLQSYFEVVGHTSGTLHYIGKKHFELPVFCTYRRLLISGLRSFSLFPNWDPSLAMCCNAWNLFYWPDLILDLFSLLSSANANDAWIEIPLSLNRGDNSKIKEGIGTAEHI